MEGFKFSKLVLVGVFVAFISLIGVKVFADQPSPQLVTPRVVMKISFAELWPIAFPKGEAMRLPTQSVVRLGVSVSLGKGWGWFVEAGIATPNNQFTPALEFATGPSVMFSQHWGMAATLVYHINPPYSGQDMTHLVGGGLAPILKINDTVSVLFVIGGAKVISGAASLSFSPKISITLPGW